MAIKTGRTKLKKASAKERASNIDPVTGKRKKMDLKIEQNITDQAAFKEQVKKCNAENSGGGLSCEDWARTKVWPDKWKKGRHKGKVGIVPVKKKGKK